MIRLPYGEKNYDNTLSRFHTIPERIGQTDRRIDGQTDLLHQYRYININVSIPMRDNNPIRKNGRWPGLWKHPKNL